MRLLGQIATSWQEPFEQGVDFYSVERAETMLSYLRSIQDELKHSTLVTIEDFVRAETFSSLLEQAEYVLSEGYFIPAGVLARAVLEEHLRNRCILENCTPVKPQGKKPMLADYNSELYKAKKYNVSVMHHVSSMIAVGNACAHNDNPNAADAQKMVRDVREFLGKHSP